MQSRKDLYQAHKLMTQRVSLALLQGTPGAAESPLRRTGVGALCGLMVTVLVATGFGIAGLMLKGGARNLEEPGLVLIEKETGASYSYSAPEHRLIPFVNYASARLAMPTTGIKRKLVSGRSLAKYSRGPVTGIPGAPESLPDPRHLTGGPWSLCVRSTAGTGGLTSSVVSLVGGRDVGGRPLGANEGVVVQGGQQAWLVWRNTRMKLTPRAVRVLTAEAPVPVDTRWLNGLPQGPDFAAPAIAGRGTRVTGPDGAPSSVGQVFRVPPVAGTPERWYVQLADGLSGISATQARLLLDETGSAAQRDITPGAAGGRASATNLHSRALPEEPPHTVAYAPTTPLCAVYRGTNSLSTDARFTVGGALPDQRTVAEAPAAGLDQVFLPGGGTFAGTLTAPGRRPESFALITDQGLRYPVPTADDVAKLGYSTQSAVPVPGNLLQLLREGPTLSSAAAVRPVAAN
ncbi:type VII secretion protein EccB [Actinomadura logoneensis]|uniref:Type VII secretion protein EccB n=1 Tax=Actinomadura logoneensis TaxID=2293572 RepID=A0A372JTM3_9ACTN|nr:type VII secretion protein EccB [Actinomadura logoneensis]RFU43310.1 type VII secretion protein EccB [Actinomadura logoneensis]